MLSRMHLKRAIKSGAGLAAVAASAFVRRSTATTGCILAYHRVADLDFVDPRHDDWNVSPAVFERQLLALMACADIVPLLTDLLRVAKIRRQPVDRRSRLRSTTAMRISIRRCSPAALPSSSDRVRGDEPDWKRRSAAVRSWSVKHGNRLDSDAWRPMNWAELKECAASGLVAIGGHSHEHLKATD